MKILITDPIDPQCLIILREEGLDVEYCPAIPPADLHKAVASADALIVRSRTVVRAEVIEAGEKLKVIGRAGVGVDNIDVEAATRRGVIVMNTPGGNTISTAEHTISMMLALARNIPQAHASLQGGRWERSAFVGMELQGKTLGIVGLGKVGSEVARRCSAFGMRVLAHDPVQTADAAAAMGVELVGFDKLLEQSDFVSIHSPLTAETRGLIGESALAKCKRGVRIIQCARGGIVDERALLDALTTGHVAGAALDVFATEPPPPELPLLHHPHVVVTPHLGASTEEAQEKVAIQIAHQVADALLGRGLSGAVNGDVVQMALRTEVQPYLQLGEKLGQLLWQLREGQLKTITVSAYGRSLHESLPALAAAVLKGIFDNVLEGPVNYISAPVIARERGIAVHLHQNDEHDLYSHVVAVRYETDRERREFSGTVFGNKDVRIVGIDGFHFEIKPEGNFLLYYNIDRPGMLASVSSILAQAFINIAGLSLGRFEPGRKALTIVAIDSAVPAHVLAQVAAIDGVSDVKLVRL